MQNQNEHNIPKKKKKKKKKKQKKKKKPPEWKGQKAFGFYTLLVSLVKVPP